MTNCWFIKEKLDKYWFNNFSINRLKMNNEFTMSLASNFGLTPDKVGITTTVK